jgi:hypothetical protein
VIRIVHVSSMRVLGAPLRRRVATFGRHYSLVVLPSLPLSIHSHLRPCSLPSPAEENPDEQTFESSESGAALVIPQQVIYPLPALSPTAVCVWLPSDVPHAPLLARDCDNVALAFALFYFSSPMKTNRHLA